MMSRLALLLLAAWLLPCPADAQRATTFGWPTRYVEGPRRSAELVGEPSSVGLTISLAPSPPSTQGFFDQGLAQVFYGGFAEAERSFQTILIADPDCPMAYWGLAQANVLWPVRARWFARAAWLKRGLAGPRERRLIDTLARFYSVLGSDEPMGMVEPWNPAPGEDAKPVLQSSDQPGTEPEVAQRLVADYRAIIEKDPADLVARALLVAALLKQRIDASGDEAIDAEIQAILDVAPDYPVHAYRLRLAAAAGNVTLGASAASAVMARASVAPAIGALAATALLRAGQKNEAHKAAAQTIELMNDAAARTWVNPKDDFAYRVAAEMIHPDWVEANQWFALQAPEWTLEDAYGRTYSLEGHRGKPLLIVNFLGFGCVHCLEQLQALQPFAAKFQELGVEIVAIGLQTPEELRVSMGDDPLKSGYSFPILCDPKLTQFKAYHSFDDFADTALHGTYLVDSEGRLRWHDISHLPYMDIESMLRTCEKLVNSPDPASSK